MTSTSVPSDFPVPPDLEGFWTWDNMHCPRPLTPMTEDIFCAGCSDGFTKGMDEFAYPMGFAYRVFNYYGYAGMVPQDLKGETMAQRVGSWTSTRTSSSPRTLRSRRVVRYPELQRKPAADRSSHLGVCVEEGHPMSSASAR